MTPAVSSATPVCPPSGSSRILPRPSAWPGELHRRIRLAPLAGNCVNPAQGRESRQRSMVPELRWPIRPTVQAPLVQKSTRVASARAERGAAQSESNTAETRRRGDGKGSWHWEVCDGKDRPPASCWPRASWLRAPVRSAVAGGECPQEGGVRPRKMVGVVAGAGGPRIRAGARVLP